ncbi:hypothetical protein ACOMHN_010263 [Nucella lapillus]
MECSSGYGVDGMMSCAPGLEPVTSGLEFRCFNHSAIAPVVLGFPESGDAEGGRKKLRSIQVMPSRNLHLLMVPPFLQPHPDLQSAVGNAPLSSKHPTQLPTTDCLLSIIPLMGGQPSDAPALSPPSPLQQGGQSSNAPALSPPSPLPQGGQPIALALSPSSPPPQDGQPSDAPGLSPSSSTLLLCPSDSTLSICHLNSQSAVKTGKPETISNYILEQKLDIMILRETWLSETGHETSCKLMTPSGFVLKSYPRASKGGGIAVIFRESLVPHVTFKKALPFRHSTFEVVELTISCSGKSTCIVCIYRPPPNAKNKFSFPLFLEEFEELVDHHNTHSPNIILIGDFNIHFDNPHNSDTKQICELLTSYELVQLVDKPTRKTHILDWIISREAFDLVRDVFINDYLRSDHSATLCSLNMTKPAQKTRLVTRRNIKAVDCDTFGTEAAAQLRGRPPSSEAALYFDFALRSFLDTHASATTKRITDRPSAPWHTPNIRTAKKQRRRAERR